MNRDLDALIVDDASHLRLLLRRILNRMGVNTVHEAENGREACKLYAELQPSLVLMDINMPVMNGIETLEEIRRINSDALVIMLTSLTTRKMVEESANAGAAYFIRKDIPIDEIEALIKEILVNKGIA